MSLCNALLTPIKNLKSIKDRFGFNTLAILFLVYWSQGFKTLSFLATTMFAKDTLKLDPGTAQLIKTLTITAWLVKPLYGFLTDNFPILGYNRKSYLFLMGILGIVSMTSLALHQNMYLAIFALILSELSQAFSDVIADALMVEKSRNDEEGSSLLQSFSWSVMGFGAVIGSVLGGFLLERFTPGTVIAMNSVSPFFLMVSSIYLEEVQVQSRGVKGQLQSLINAVKDPVVYKSLIFVLILRGSSPRFSELYYYFLIDVLKMTPLFISSLGVFSYASMIFAGYFYHNFLKEKEYRNILCQGQVIVAALYLVDVALVLKFYLFLHVPAWTFVLGGEVSGTVIDFCFISMPILVLGAQICPKGIEATFFSLFTSVYNIGGSISGLFGGYLIKIFDVKAGDYSLFWVLILIQIFFKLMPLFFLKLLPDHKKPVKESELEMVSEKESEDGEINLDQIFSGHSSLIHS